MAAWSAHPLAMQSVELRVLDGSVLKLVLIASRQIGIRVASPTSSTKSISVVLRPDLTIAS
jgi:hypothetical protein